MAWNQADETVVGGTGEVYVAPVGTALPAGPGTALNSAFEGLGYHSEDGVSVNRTQEIFRVGAWQTTADVRRERQSESFRLTFALLQWNENNVPLAFGGGAITSVSGGYKYTPPAESDALDEKALICDVRDGAETLRFVIPRGNVVESVDTQFTRSQASLLPITFEALTPEDGSASWYFLATDAGFAEGS